MVYIPVNRKIASPHIMEMSNAPRPITVLVVDDHPLLRAGLGEAIASQDDMLSLIHI